ncbi:MAG TPA: hypothetical protein VFA90_02130 [Terriglobales bacterium]|nr:hypothetical protein [Terriglobales bacterium]
MSPPAERPGQNFLAASNCVQKWKPANEKEVSQGMTRLPALAVIDFQVSFFMKSNGN